MKKLIWTFSLIIGLTGCSGSREESEKVPVFPEGPTAVEVASDISVRLNSEESAVSESFNRFGHTLIREAVERAITAPDDRDKGIAISPLSVSMALGLIASSCDDAAAADICNILGYDDLTTLESASTKLMAYLSAPENGAVVELANSVWYSDRYLGQVLPTYVAKMNATYFADINSVDFTSPEGLETINVWAREKTHGLIPDINEMLDPSLETLILNATYFAGEWLSKFDVQDTSDELFHAPKGDMTVKMMHQKSSLYSYYEDTEKIVVNLPFKGYRTYATFMLPKGNFTLSDICPDYEEWQKIRRKSVPSEVTLSLPRFSHSALFGLNDFPCLDTFKGGKLEKMGLNIGYNLTLAQKSIVKVDEEGAKAAAVTAGFIGSFGDPVAAKKTVTLDRPFLYYLHNVHTGSIIMAGYILEPNQAE